MVLFINSCYTLQCPNSTIRLQTDLFCILSFPTLPPTALFITLQPLKNLQIAQTSSLSNTPMKIKHFTTKATKQSLQIIRPPFQMLIIFVNHHTITTTHFSLQQLILYKLIINATLKPPKHQISPLCYHTHLQNFTFTYKYARNHDKITKQNQIFPLLIEPWNFYLHSTQTIEQQYKLNPPYLYSKYKPNNLPPQTPPNPPTFQHTLNKPTKSTNTNHNSQNHYNKIHQYFQTQIKHSGQYHCRIILRPIKPYSGKKHARETVVPFVCADVGRHVTHRAESHEHTQKSHPHIDHPLDISESLKLHFRYRPFSYRRSLEDVLGFTIAGGNLSIDITQEPFITTSH